MSGITRYSDAELEAMLAGPESDLVERKRSFRGDSPTKVRVDVCAFANDLPAHGRAGVIVVGIEDDGSPAGLDISDALLRELADMKTDGRIVPPPSLTVQKRTLLGAEVAVVTVEPSDSPPVRFDGRVHIRIGSRRGIASAQDERILAEKRRHRDQPFDARPVRSARVGELNRRFFEEDYLPAAFAPEVLEANERSYEQRLSACKMVAAADDPVPTVLGVLVLAAKPRDHVPGAYVQFLRIDGDAYGDPISDELHLDGPLSSVVRLLDDKLTSHNRVAVDLQSGPKEVRRSTYPLAALQQLTRNALLHRTYDLSHAPVRVYWFDDRIEIINPGGPYGSVTEENFGQPGVTDYRNPNVAEALRVLGLVQRFGFGIQLARKLLAENGNPPPEFALSRELVTCRVYARRA